MKTLPDSPSLTLEEWKQLANVRNIHAQQYREEVAHLRSQLMQLQKIAEHFERVYYMPMTKSLWRRVWFAWGIKRRLKRENRK